ncbi:hypothetical protein Tco_0430115, partial [Tanacetum coccineum]
PEQAPPSPDYVPGSEHDDDEIVAEDQVRSMILKITILKTNTLYPSRNIRCIRAYTHQRPQRKKAQYTISREDQYAVLEIWNEYNILEDIKRGPYSKKSPICRIQSLNTPYRTDF